MSIRQKIKRILAIAICLLVASFIAVLLTNNRFDESSRDVHATYKKYGVEVYSITNKWPESSIFFKKCYGLKNTETGEDTGAIYPAEPVCRWDDHAWDYLGHYIDCHGNIVVDCSELEKESRPGNPRINSIDAFGEILYHDHTRESALNESAAFYVYQSVYLSYVNGKNFTDLRGGFGSNGLAFYAQKAPAETHYYYLYGYINKDGEIAIPMKFIYASNFMDNGLAIAAPYESSGGFGAGLINEKGEFVVEPKYDDIKYHDGYYEATYDYYDKEYFDDNGNPISKPVGE